MSKTPQKKGFLIVFEGGEGSGKSTQIRLLGRFLQRKGFPVLTTRQPGGSALGRAVRKWLLRGGLVHPRAELLLYSADRAQHVEEVLVPALKEGKIVLCDRYADSTTIYQGIGRNLGVANTQWLNNFATNRLTPDLVIVLDVPPAVGLKRAQKRGQLDRFEKEQIRFHRQVRNGFLKLAQAKPSRYVVLDGSQSLETISHSLKVLVEKRLKRRRDLWQHPQR